MESSSASLVPFLSNILEMRSENQEVALQGWWADKEAEQWHCIMHKFPHFPGKSVRWPTKPRFVDRICSFTPRLTSRTHPLISSQPLSYIMCEQEKPTTEHAWLTQLVGEWSGESECIMGPDQPPVKGKAKEVIRSIGALWIVCEGSGEMPGSDDKSESIITIGYDPKKGSFSGSFVCNMMTRLWVYEGKLEGNKLTLLATGPSWSDPSKIVQYSDVTELVSADHKILRSYNLENPDAPVCFMTMHFHRVKK